MAQHSMNINIVLYCEVSCECLTFALFGISLGLFAPGNGQERKVNHLIFFMQNTCIKIIILALPILQ